MTLTVKLFAAARVAAGRELVTVVLSEPATMADLRSALVAAAPGLARFGVNLWVAVNGDYAADTDVLPPQAEIACFPPVSGG